MDEQGTLQDPSQFSAPVQPGSGMGEVVSPPRTATSLAAVPARAFAAVADVAATGMPIPWAKAAWGMASLAGMSVGAYHGYKRNNSIGWAIGWALLGGLFPVIVVPIAVAQGLGKQSGRK